MFNVCNPPNLKIDPGIVFSRFPAMPDCCRKALYAMVLSRLRQMLPCTAPLNDGTLIPQQWALPRQKELLREHCNSRAAEAAATGAPKPIFIVKPDHGCQGVGIELTNDPCKQSPYAKDAVVQEYIGNPLLLDGLKFDLRLYVLVTSVGGDADGGPMRVFLCREGMARFAVEAFDGAELKNVHAHLTNYSLNKKSQGFRASDAADGGAGSKRTISSVFAALQRSGQLADVEALWERIGVLVVRALSVVQPVLAHARRQWSETPCFQILGFDVLLDSELQPWLIEINDHPSLRIDRQHSNANSADSPTSEGSSSSASNTHASEVRTSALSGGEVADGAGELDEPSNSASACVPGNGGVHRRRPPATPPSGLKWERIDARVAAEGTPLVCDNLTEALGRRSQSRDVSFSEAEWAAFGVSKPLRATHFVAAGDAYFRPVPPASPSPLPPPPVQTQYSTASSVGPDAGRGGLSAFFFGGGVGAGGGGDIDGSPGGGGAAEGSGSAADRKPNGLIGHFNEMLYLDVSAVDETIKVPMLADVLRIVAEVHGLEYTRRPEHDPEIMKLLPSSPPGRPRGSDDGNASSEASRVDRAQVPKFAFGTSFVELDASAKGPEGSLIAFFDKLRTLFEWHTPEGMLIDGQYRKNIDSQVLPGPRWKLPVLANFLHTVAGIGKAESERLFQAVCGKGGSMDLIDFAEVCGRVARKLHEAGGETAEGAASRRRGSGGEGMGIQSGKPASPKYPPKAALRPHNSRADVSVRSKAGKGAQDRHTSSATAPSVSPSLSSAADVSVDKGPSAVELIEALLDTWSMADTDVSPPSAVRSQLGSRPPDSDSKRVVKVKGARGNSIVSELRHARHVVADGALYEA